LSAPGYVSKSEMRDVKLFGPAITGIRTIYLERSKGKEAKNYVKAEIKERQNQIDRLGYGDFMIFPEGTTTNNECLLMYKRGAFEHLYPVNPVVIKYEGPYLIPTFEAMPAVATLCFAMCVPYGKVTCTVLPPFKPNEYLYENFKHFGKEKPEIFAEAIRSISSEVSGLPKVENQFLPEKLEFKKRIV